MVLRRGPSHSFTMSFDEDDVKTIRKPYFRTLKEYSASSTTHGIAYVFEDNRLFIERVLWIIIVIIAICIAAFLSIGAYNNWQDNPVLTSVGTTGYPIENVKFPSITICAQGSAKQVVDAALFMQFNGYLQVKGKKFSEMSPDDLVDWGHKFLVDKYPGAKLPPNQLVSMMSSPNTDADKTIKADAIFNPQPTNNCPDSSTRDKRDIRVKRGKPRNEAI